MSEALEGVIDEVVLDDLRQLDDEDGGFFEEVVQAYVQDAHVLLDDLRVGISCGNAEETARAAHQLKTPSFQLGALGLGELCQQVEEKSRAGSCEGLETLLPAIAAQVVAVCTALKTQVEASTRRRDEPGGP